MRTVRNPYKTLAVSETATSAEIRKAYLALVRKHHPDVNPGNSDAGEKIRAINWAYELLIDEERRRLFDAENPRSATADHRNAGTRSSETTGTSDSHSNGRSGSSSQRSRTASGSSGSTGQRSNQEARSKTGTSSGSRANNQRTDWTWSDHEVPKTEPAAPKPRLGFARSPIAWSVALILSLVAVAFFNDDSSDSRTKVVASTFTPTVIRQQASTEVSNVFAGASGCALTDYFSNVRGTVPAGTRFSVIYPRTSFLWYVEQSDHRRDYINPNCLDPSRGALTTESESPGEAIPTQSPSERSIAKSSSTTEPTSKATYVTLANETSIGNFVVPKQGCSAYSSDYDIVGRVLSGASVTVLSRSSPGWWLVRSGSGEPFLVSVACIPSSFVGAQSTQPSTKTPSDSSKLEDDSTRLWFTVGPLGCDYANSSSDAAGRLSPGIQVEVLLIFDVRRWQIRLDNDDRVYVDPVCFEGASDGP